MRTLCISALLLSMAAPFTFAEDAPRKSNLPKVLIIGDSISLGYTPFVKEKLGGKAEVIHHRGNAGPTIRGLVQINQWLGDTQWEVIHFNWGLWDMYGWEYAKEERSPAVYEQRLETLVRRLERTEARLIWGTTTPACPEPEVTMQRRFNSEVTIRLATEQQYLDAALRVMNKHNVQVNDLHALILPLLKKYALAPNNVHFTNEGYRKLGSQVADAIQENLGSEQSDGEATSETVPSAPVGQVSPPVPSESRDR